MKKVLLILGVVLLGLTSCKKEEVEIESSNRLVKIDLRQFGDSRLDGCQFKAEVNDTIYYYRWREFTPSIITSNDLFSNKINLESGDIINVTAVVAKVYGSFPQIPIHSGYDLYCISNDEVIFNDRSFNNSFTNNDTTRYSIVIP